ncbi:MAG: DUF2974 domain-containing protein [Ruminococcaceae bacterium]|nr:DUF2974 domain-containing protein [Oscillospiraceae bacterium]
MVNDMAYTDQETRAFTQIAYANLSKGYDALRMENPDRTSFTLEELKEASILAGVKESELSQLNCLTDDQMKNWKISAVHDQNDVNGFYACVIETGPGEAAVGFRGSEGMGELDNVVNDWVGADIGLVNSTCTNQQAEVDRFLEKYKDQLNGYDNLAMAGHSLGGNLAEYATIVSSEYGLDDNIKQCVSMDGPGFSKEFIDKYRDQIEKMSGVMYHPRWSFVGTMLNDLPRVNYEYVEVANKDGVDGYNALTRHSTEYLVYDENGNLVEGEQDDLSKITSVISEGVDHLPAPIGNALITLVGGAWIGFTWAKENILDDDGKITPTGWDIVTGAVGVVAVLGLKTVVVTVAAVAVAIISVIAVAVITELVYDTVMIVANSICDMVGQFLEWPGEVSAIFRKTVLSMIVNASAWFNSNFNSGYRTASFDPTIRVDTAKLRGYAERLGKVNQRLTTLDGRMDDLYFKVGLRDLFNLIHADLWTGSNWRITNCAKYLNETANDFEGTERNVVGQFQG